MKLGVFDSGLGGLLITKAIQSAMPDLDILYYGDTLHLPYGNRSEAAIYTYTRNAMDYMFSQDCKLIVIACNTASAAALRRLQQEYLPLSYKDRNIIGVVVPTLETAIERGYKRLGLIATNAIVNSNVYQGELTKLNPHIRIFQQATPLLVPLLENDGMQWVGDVLEHYLRPLLAQDIDSLLLGCTHYPLLKQQTRDIVGGSVDILSQDEIIPAKLADYLRRHPEYSDGIARTGRCSFHLSDVTPGYRKAAEALYGGEITLRHIQDVQEAA